MYSTLWFYVGVERKKEQTKNDIFSDFTNWHIFYCLND